MVTAIMTGSVNVREIGGFVRGPWRPRIPPSARLLKIFAIFDPTTSLITTADPPRITLKREESITGSEVPPATMVAPMMNGEIQTDSSLRAVVIPSPSNA